MLTKTELKLQPWFDTLVSSFLKIILLYQGMQILIFIAYALPFHFFKQWFLMFCLSSLGFHIFLFFLLFTFRADFVNDSDGTKLEKINLANSITLFRISTLPTMLFILLASKTKGIGYPIFALALLVFASDFADGYISRRYKEATRAGKMMDSAGDYALLFVITIVFYYFGIIPVWFAWLFIFRLFSQFILLIILLAVKKQLIIRTSFLGKATIASTMVLYAFEMLRLFCYIPMLAYQLLEYIAGFIVALSIFDKILIMLKDLRASPPEKMEPGRLNTQKLEL